MTQPNGIPAGYHSVQPYLMFVDTVEAIAFYTEIFGAKEKLCMKSPEGRVVHAEIEIGDSVIMLADENPSIEAFATVHYGGSPVSLMLYVSDCDATCAAAIEAGATGLREPADQPYGDRMGGIVDPFGYKWWIAHSIAPQQRGDQ